MTAERFATEVLFLATLVMPLVLFAAGSLSRSTPHNLLRACAAIGVGWALAVAYVVAAQAIYASTATPAELLALYDRDGAPRAFAAVLGWLPATFLVAVAWVVRSVFARRRKRHGL